MKKYLVFYLLILLAYTVNAQLGLRLGRVMPMGEYGQTFKPTFSGEISFNSAIERQYKIGVAFGFYMLQPKQDTFHLSGYTYSNGQPFPAYEAYKNYYAFTFLVTNDYKIPGFPKAFSPSIGFDAGIYVNLYNYSTSIPSLSYSQMYDDYLFAIVPKVGFTSEVNDHILLYGGVGFSAAYDLDRSASQTYFKPHIGIVYYFPDGFFDYEDNRNW